MRGGHGPREAFVVMARRDGAAHLGSHQAQQRGTAHTISYSRHRATSSYSDPRPNFPDGCEQLTTPRKTVTLGQKAGRRPLSVLHPLSLSLAPRTPRSNQRGRGSPGLLDNLGVAILVPRPWMSRSARPALTPLSRGSNKSNRWQRRALYIQREMSRKSCLCVLPITTDDFHPSTPIHGTANDC